MKRLLDHRGQPLARKPEVRKPRSAPSTKMFGGMNGGGYLTSLLKSDQPARFRAQDPLTSNPWVFSAAFLTAIVAGQAPFLVWRETPEELRSRQVHAKRAGRQWFGCRAGSRRRAFERHLQGQVGLKRLTMRSAEPDWDHPLTDLLRAPNPVQSQMDVFMTTFIWLQIRGEVFWLLTDDDGGTPSTPYAATRLWALSPDLFKPRLSRGSSGELVGWEYSPAAWMPNAQGGIRIHADLDQVTHLRFADPSHPLRALSRLAPVASRLELDAMTLQHLRNVVRNDARPGGFLETTEEMDNDQKLEFLMHWVDVHGGMDKSGRPAILDNGLTWNDVAWSPRDLEFLENNRITREEIMAVSGSSPSIHGLTEFTNYATALGQRKNYWDHTILPLMRVIESSLDRTLFFPETDDVFGAFDLRGIEALRAGLLDQVKAARELVHSDLHMTPDVAYGVVGIDVPDYAGRDVAFAPINLIPVPQILDGSALGPSLEPSPPADPSKPPEAEDDKPAEEANDDPSEGAEAATAKRAQVTAKSRAKWRRYITLEIELEAVMRSRYRRWVNTERKAALERFDAATSKARAKGIHTKADIDLSEILPGVTESGNRLAAATRPVYLNATEKVIELTSNELGIPVFDVGEPRIQQYWTTRERVFKKNTPRTIFKRLRDTMAEGVKQGETLPELRARIGQAYDVERSHYRTLTIARTETAGLMSGIREQMFEIQGVTTIEWFSAGDEATREDHITFGNAGPRERGFNFLDLVGGSGSLTHPGDSNGPAEQVINCRCAHFAGEAA